VQNVVLSILVNGMMAALLLVTIVYCWRLNNRIRILQDSKSELARIIREFNESTERATQSIADIHEATNRISENIQHKIDRANFLATDLDMLIEKGGRLTSPAAAAPRASSSAAAAPSAATPRAPRPESAMAAAAGNIAGVTPLADADMPRRAAPGTARPRSRAEQEILSALKSKNEGR